MMTEEEARKVIAILEEADNRCHVCVGILLRLFKFNFPQFAYLVDVDG